MATEDLLVHDGGNRQAIEAVGKCLPQLYVKPPFALIVEAVDAVDARTLVVSSEQEEILGVLDLIRQQQADGFQRLLPSVHVIPQEEVVGFWGEAAIFKQPE